MQSAEKSEVRGRMSDKAGRYSLVKELLAGPQRPVREAQKKDGPSTLREFVALFCTKGRDKRRVWGWKVVDGQGVKNYRKSGENYFGRILLPGRTGARRQDDATWRSRMRGEDGTPRCVAGVNGPNRSVKRVGWPIWNCQTCIEPAYWPTWYD